MRKIIELGKGIGIFFLYLFLPLVVVNIFSSLFRGLNQTILLISTQTIVLLVLMVIFRKVLISDFKTINKAGLKQTFKYWGFGFLAMVVFNIIILTFINPGGLAANEELNRELLGSNIIFALFAMVIFAPIAEELVFRAGFKKVFNNAFTFATFSGLFFGLIHVAAAFLIPEGGSNLVELVYIFPYMSLGFAFAYAYFKTNNIYNVIIVHAAHNAFAVSVILLSMLLS